MHECFTCSALLAPQALALSRNGELLFSGSDDKTIRMWRAADGECTHVLEGHQGYLQALAYRHAAPDSPQPAA